MNDRSAEGAQCTCDAMRRPHGSPTWLFLLVFFSAFSVCIPVRASDPQPALAFQTYILLQFKQAITNDPLDALHSWTNESTTSLSPPHFCKWLGITCDSQQHSFVVSIALMDLKLKGSITPLIGSLTSLVFLDLSNNSLSGFVPSALGTLSNLHTLKLSLNSFAGSIPASLSNCSSLALLDVSDNTMSGSIPAQLGALPFIKGLLLSHNLFDGTLPPSIFNASALQFLDISHNRITGPVPNIVSDTTSLLSLNLASNNLTGSIPDTVSKLVSLQGLDFSNNMLNGGIPSELAAFIFLGTVILSSNQLKGHIPASLGEMQSLRVLQLNNNMLSGAIPASLGNCKRLEDLVLSHNLLAGGIPIAVASLSNLLFGFDVSNNLLRGPIPSQIGSMSRVLKIDLSQNELSGNISEQLDSCISLEYLDLSNNQLKGPIPQGIGSLRSLTWMLNLSHNFLEGSIPDLQGLDYLRVVDLSHNELTGLVPSSLSSLYSLIFFNLSFNNLSGCFPLVGDYVHVNSSWIQGNPNLCGPSSLSHICRSHSCAPSSQRSTDFSRHPPLPLYIWFLLVIAFLIWLGIGIFFFLSKLLKSRLYTYSYIPSRDQKDLVLSIMRKFKNFSVEELNTAINSGETSSRLVGSGASSDVYRVQFGNNQVYALKRFKPTARQRLFNAELEVLTNLRHRNLVSIRGACNQGPTRAILLDYMENGSLKKQLYDVPSCALSLERRIAIARDVAEGLVYLHSYSHVPVIHCDVKPGNILLDEVYRAHVADFGLAYTYTVGGLTYGRRRGQQGLSSTLLRLPGTVGYIAPEYAAFKTTPSTAGDVYSYGVVLLELLTRRKPGQGNFPPGIYSLPALVQFASLENNLESLLDVDLRVQLRTRSDYDKVALLASIALSCASEDPTLRPSMEQVVSSLKYHPTFLEQNSEGSSNNQVTNGEIVVDNDVGMVVNADVSVLNDEVVVNVGMGVHSEVSARVLAG